MNEKIREAVECCKNKQCDMCPLMEEICDELKVDMVDLPEELVELITEALNQKQVSIPLM